jgi:hypothetical protein
LVLCGPLALAVANLAPHTRPQPVRKAEVWHLVPDATLPLQEILP